MIEILGWIASILSISGAILNAYKIRFSFYIWLVANLIWIIVCILNNNVPQIPMWSIYAIISIIGLIQWKKDDSII